jgi:integral membrane protein
MIPLLRFFRVSGALEAVSFLVLVLIAMPLKHIYGKPYYVRWMGPVHGTFFILFCLAVVVTARRKGWPARVTMLAFLSSLLPFGPFLFERFFLQKDDTAKEWSWKKSGHPES